MAHLKNKYFGDMKGKFGDVVFRVRNGKNYAAQTPRKYTKPDTLEYKKRISSFKLSTRFSSSLVRTPELKNIWKTESIKSRTLYQHIISLCYNNLRSEENIVQLKITPEKGFNADFENVILNDSTLSFTVKPLGNDTGINLSNETKIKLVTLCMLYDAKVEGKSEYDLFFIKSGIVPLVVEEELIFNINLTATQQHIVSQYKELRVYSSLITYTDESAQINYSDTLFNKTTL